MDENHFEQLKGTVETVVFRNEVTGFSVLEFDTENGEIISAVGILPDVEEGEQLNLMGNRTVHPSFGEQFRVETYEKVKPTDSPAILRYLSSGILKGIGPATAAKMVQAFGDKTLEILEKEPERLCEIKGFTLKKAREVSEQYQKMFGVRDVMLYFGQYDITPMEALKIWKIWGAGSVEKIKANPYLLCVEGLSIGFERADKIAKSLSFPPEDEQRVRAGMLYVIKHNMMGNGHTCLPEGKVLEISSQFLEIPLEVTREIAEKMKTEDSLVGENIDGVDFLFTPASHRYEVYAAGRLQMMLMFPPQSFSDVEEDIDRIEQEKGIRYEKMQRQAIIQALSRGILVLTGGPGTGKTTTLNAIIQLLEWKGEKVALTAPTGRAAKRMSQVTGKEAKTIHRLLEVEWNEEDHPIFARNEKNLLECNALIVDELSMVDSALFSSLLSALPLGCRLVLVGDSDQLPSVGAGNVLHDIIDSGVIPVVRLQEVFRQSMQSLIVSNAHRIVCGELPILTQRDNDFFFIRESNASEISRIIMDLCAKRLPQKYGYTIQNQIQVLCPGRKGELGSVELNKQLQAVINPPARNKREITIHGNLLREQDKVMQIKNDYDIAWTKDDGTTGTGIYNGDIGVLEIADKASGSVVVRYEDREAVYNLESAENLSLAYAMTVHKSQGNEFEAVVMPMYPGAPQLYYRNLLYTAVTRAKDLLILVGHPNVVRTMVDNNKKTRRYSGLRHFLTAKEEEKTTSDTQEDYPF